MPYLINKKVLRKLKKRFPEDFKVPASCSECDFKIHWGGLNWECMLDIATAKGLTSGGANVEDENREPYDFRPEWCPLADIWKEDG